MSTMDTRDKLAAALKRAVAEHGTPNSFSPGELERLYGGPSAREAGRIGLRYIIGLRRAAEMPSLEYEKRRFWIK